MLRMTDTAVSEAASEAARALIRQRWGAQRPIKLARELASRVDELPAVERARLRAALDENVKGN
jgi:hypothetical protein